MAREQLLLSLLLFFLLLLLFPPSTLGQENYVPGGFAGDYYNFGRGGVDDDLRGDYCRNLRCCPYRDDACSVPILGTRCYCDVFCYRGGEGADCCPDFRAVCRGVPGEEAAVQPPAEVVRPQCLYEGKYYEPGHTIHINCNKCTCRQKANFTAFDFECEQNVCLVRPDLISSINDGRHLWKATNYSFFWGETLHDGLKHRLGTFKPTRPTMEMNEIHQLVNGPLPPDFDSREKWRNLITPVRDQGDCASSWAFSTTALSSDRLAIESLGMERIELSPQHLLSCQRRGQRACHGGHLDKAWYFLRKNGVTTGDCFPYSGKEESPCPFDEGAGQAPKFEKVRCPTGGEGKLYFMTPPYRVGPKEEEIMRELYFNGPVQATFRVQPDFFLYRSGVYHHDDSLSDHLPQPFRQQDWHSVRILGWGQEVINGKKIKFWTCANSWGDDWGEDGYFRILRGQDECDIEMFIVGVWARPEPNQ